MTSMEYDMDSMGGLMPQILALTAPPGSREPNRQHSGGSTGSAKEGLAAHPYFRRPGRGHNHDSCDACGEGGDLICCDVCPASFHLMCHDPPLDEEDIPIGRWACHQCRVSGPDDDRTSVSSGKSNKSVKGIKRKEKEDDKPTTSVTGRSDSNDKRVCSGGREFEISDSPLATLIKAAAAINPKQFTLPFEMTLPVCFPGEPKITVKSNGTRKGAQKKKAHELDNGLVPLPAKLCFQCNKSCRIGPLVPCDYCQLFFHLDCLDPPLTTPPMGKWMCPNHPENFLDSTLLTSQSLSQRVKLWDKFNVPVDQDAIRLKFLQQCHRKNPPFRYKVKRALRSRIRVPPAVKEQYSEPSELLLRHGPPQHLLPPVTDHDTETSNATTVPTTAVNRMATIPVKSCGTTVTVTNWLHQNNWRGAEVKEKPVVNSEIHQDESEGVENESKCEEKRSETERKKATKEEMDEWLAGLLCLQASIVKHMANNSTGSLNKAPEKQGEMNGPASLGSNIDMSPPLEKPGCMNGDLTSHDLSSKHSRLADSRKQQAVINSNFQPPPTYLPTKKGILKNQKGKSVTNPGTKATRHRKQTASEILSETLTSLASSLQNSITGKQEVSLSQLERSVVDVLAWQRLEELLCPPSPAPAPVVTQPLPAHALLCPLVPDSHLQDWAVKSPVPSYCSQPVAMTYRIIRIGKGSHNHVDLCTYGYCNYTSQEHAAIFFDENTGHYELLNYSPHGTSVDGVMYRYDHSEKTVNHAPPPPLLQQVRAIINQKRGQPVSRPSEDAMTDTPGQTLSRCNCRRGKTKMCSTSTVTSSYNLGNGGWEGGAVLHHGSHLRFGCLQFVFSIVEEASKADWIDTTLNTYDKFFKQEEEEEKEEQEEKIKEEVEEDDEEEEEDEKVKKEEKNSKS